MHKVRKIYERKEVGFGDSLLPHGLWRPVYLTSVNRKGEEKNRNLSIVLFLLVASAVDFRFAQLLVVDSTLFWLTLLKWSNSVIASSTLALFLRECIVAILVYDLSVNISRARGRGRGEFAPGKTPLPNWKIEEIRWRGE